MSAIDELKNHKVGILGFGQEGQAILKYLTEHEISATVYDEKDGADYLNGITDCTLLFRSPGIWRNHPKILAAEQAGVIITSQTKWFFKYSPATIVGVTGTKGKGTTSALIFEIMKAAGKIPNENLFLTGNIGKIQPLEFLDQSKAGDVVVYELSSFQLQDLTQSPHIGICLMTTSDHLNHHEDLNEYHHAKESISAFQSSSDISIYNTDYEATVKIGEMGLGEKLTISAKVKPSKGAFITNNTISIVNEAEQTIDCSNRKLRGEHNLENIAAAALAGLKLNVPIEKIAESVKDFSGLEHRLQFVGEFNGVGYYNDSISTVPETAIAAIKSFTEPLHLLLGGSNKGLDYSELIKFLATRENVVSISLLGEVGKQLNTLLTQAEIKIPTFGPYQDFSAAINEIKTRAKAGEIVLLSPASASFDMFENYADRGNQFSNLVKN